ncbi:hypothetical protein AB0F20_10295 [Streptomyces goshikiensis]|uniref:hypothetical protein n=1 Tax=Streptomyces goshikiensis TaxID=1942 RepID=UPI003405EC69
MDTPAGPQGRPAAREAQKTAPAPAEKRLTAADLTHCRIGIDYQPARGVAYWRLDLLTAEAGRFIKTTDALISAHPDPVPVANAELAVIGLEIDPTREPEPLATYYMRPTAKASR